MALAWGVAKAQNDTSGVPIVVDTQELAMIGKLLRSSGKAGTLAFRGAMKAGGELVANDARQRASYSKRIPGSIVVRSTGSNFKVRAGGEAAPDAAPIENRGKGFVRHPTFSPRFGGERIGWTEKNSHPAFLSPALEAQADNVVAVVTNRLEAAIDAALGGR